MRFNILKYISHYKYKIEFHAHTTPELPGYKMIALLKNQGYHAVMLTNHFLCSMDNRLNGEEYVKNFLEELYSVKEEGIRQGIKVFMGAEIRFEESRNEYLVLGVNNELLNNILQCGGIEEFHNRFHKDDILVIQAHPFRNHCGCFPVNPDFIDGMEIMNMHTGQMSSNAVASDYAAKRFSIVTAGSDAHCCEHIGLSALKTKVLPESEKELLEILTNKEYIFEIGKCPMLPHAFFK